MNIPFKNIYKYDFFSIIIIQININIKYNGSWKENEVAGFVVFLTVAFDMLF